MSAGGPGAAVMFPSGRGPLGWWVHQSHLMMCTVLFRSGEGLLEGAWLDCMGQLWGCGLGGGGNGVQVS